MKIAVASLLLVFFTVLPAQAAAPDIDSLPLIKGMKDTGTKFYFMGERSGLSGWVILRDGKMQTIYVTPDRKSVIFGGMFGEDGTNITSTQFTAVLAKDKDLKTALEKAFRGEPLPTGVGSDKSPPEGVSINLGEKLYDSLARTAGVTVGDETAPLLLMVVDPHCPYCKATWKMLRDEVVNKKLRVKLIPIGAEDSENERRAAVFLGVKQPLIIWNKFIDGDKTVLDGTPPKEAIETVRKTHDLIDSWKIKNTPYLVYRDAAQKVKVVIGQPENIAAVLTDLYPQQAR